MGLRGKKGGKSVGFSLVEMLVVIFVIGISLPVLFNITYIDIINQEKTLILQEVKENGDFALSQIETVVRNRAEHIVNSDRDFEYCEPGTTGTVPLGGSAHFQDEDGNFFSYSLDTTDENAVVIASSSANGTYLLTNSHVHVENLVFKCTRTSDYSSPIVSVTFTLSQRLDKERYEEKNSLNFISSVKLLNYGSE